MEAAPNTRPYLVGVPFTSLPILLRFPIADLNTWRPHSISRHTAFLALACIAPLASCSPPGTRRRASSLFLFSNGVCVCVALPHPLSLFVCMCLRECVCVCVCALEYLFMYRILENVQNSRECSDVLKFCIYCRRLCQSVQ